jgi:hypothetical protein
MDRSMDFCRSKAAEYTRRAEESTDREMRAFFYRLRDNWLRVSRSAETYDSPDPGLARALPFERLGLSERRID